MRTFVKFTDLYSDYVQIIYTGNFIYSFCSYGHRETV